MNLMLYWAQVRDLTLASMKSRYRKTWAGFIWVILSPLLMFGVQSLVFSRFLKLQVPNYALFLVGGLLPWIFLSSTVQMGTPVFVTQSQLLRSFKINPFVVLCSQVLDNFINFVASFLIILIPIYFYTNKSLMGLTLIPLVMIPLFLGTFSLTVALALLNVFFRDTTFVMNFIFSLLFFITPVFYPKEYIPAEYHWVSVLNPVTYLIEPFRLVIYEGAVESFGVTYLKSMAMALAFTVVALVYWKRKVNEFYRRI